MFQFRERPNDGKCWDAQDIEKLHYLLALETPISAVAQELGRSQEAVKRKAAKLDRLPA